MFSCHCRNNVDLVASDGYRMVRSDGTIIESNPDRYPINGKKFGLHLLYASSSE